jgi:hypothetical protein
MVLCNFFISVIYIMSSLLRKIKRTTEKSDESDSDIEGGKRKPRKSRIQVKPRKQKKPIFDPIPSFANDSFVNYTIPPANKIYLNDLLVKGQPQAEKDFTYNIKNAEDYNKAFYDNFVLNISNVQSIFEFLFRKLGDSRIPNQEVYDKTRKLYATLQTMYEALDDAKDTAYLLDQKNRENIIKMRKVIVNFASNVIKPLTRNDVETTRFSLLKRIVGGDAVELNNLIQGLDNMLEYTQNIYNSQGVPIQPQVGSGVEEDLGMIKFPPPKKPVLIQPSKFMEYDLVIQKPVPFKIIDPLGVSQFHFDFPYENVDSRQYFNNPTMFPIN